MHLRVTGQIKYRKQNDCCVVRLGFWKRLPDRLKWWNDFSTFRSIEYNVSVACLFQCSVVSCTSPFHWIQYFCRLPFLAFSRFLYFSSLVSICKMLFLIKLLFFCPEANDKLANIWRACRRLQFLYIYGNVPDGHRVQLWEEQNSFGVQRSEII